MKKINKQFIKNNLWVIRDITFVILAIQIVMIVDIFTDKILTMQNEIEKLEDKIQVIEKGYEYEEDEELDYKQENL